jgi:hypothetical protein
VVSGLTDHVLIDVFSFSLALIYSSFVGTAILTALRTSNDDRRKAAIQVLKILIGSKSLKEEEREAVKSQ